MNQVMAAEQQVDVVVIGGGLAGLTTAVGLRDSGLKVVVVERDTILGGRARSWTDQKTGDPVHIGPHIFLDTCYRNMFRLLELLGTRDKIVWEKDGRFITMADGTRTTVIKSSFLPPPYHFVPSLLADSQVSLRDLISNWPVVQLAINATEEEFLKLDHETAADLLTRLGVTPRFIQRFWKFTAMSIMNVPLERCSAGALLRFYKYLTGRKDLQVGFPDGGLGDLFAPQSKALIEKHGGTVLTGVTVKEVLADERGLTGVTLSDGRTITARRIVAALPPPALRSLARPEWKAADPLFGNLEKFEPCPYISLFIWFDRKLTPLQMWARAFDEQDLNCDFYDLSNIHTGWEQRPSLITSNVIYCHRANGMTDEEVLQGTLNEIFEFLPHGREAKVVHSVVNRIPMAIHCPYPGTEKLRPPVRTGVKGLYVAGDWIQTGFPSSMESAVRAGWMCAEAILEDEGKPANLSEANVESTGLTSFLKRRSTPRTTP